MSSAREQCGVGCESWHRPPLSLLQAKETQLRQPFLVKEMLQSLHHFCGSALDSLKQFPVLEQRGPELHIILQMRSHQGRVEGGG